MSERDEIHAAVGRMVIQATWVEFLTARLVAQVGSIQDEMDLLKTKTRKVLFREARDAAEALPDAGLANRTRMWLDRAQSLLDRRDEVVHSIVTNEYESVWTAYHPKTRRLIQSSPPEMIDLARRLEELADDANYSSLFDWPQPERSDPSAFS